MKQKIIIILLSLFALPFCTMAEDQIRDLDPVITEHRHLHVLENVLNDFLDLQFDQIIFEYNSVGPDLKTPVRLTACLNMPPNVYNKESQPRAMVIYNEFTTAKHGERTSQNEINDVAFFVNKLENFIVLATDLYGWTLTEDKPQGYCIPELTSRETLDAWDAAMILLEREGYQHKDLPVFNIGYSSGGFSAMAVQKYINENRPDINVKALSAGGSPHDITTVYENYVKTDYIGYKCALPLMIVAYKELYGLPYSYQDIFLPPLSENIQEWILSKDYNTWEINEKIGLEAKTSEIMTPAVLNYTEGIGRDLYMKFRNNSLCGPFIEWQPSTDTKYFIFHSAGDTYMHYFVGLEMANYLTKHGCEVKTDFADWGDHINYGIYSWIIQTLVFIENNINDSMSDEIQDSIDDLKDDLSDIEEDIPMPGYTNDDKGAGQTNNIISIQDVKNISTSDAEGYYSLSGKKLNGKPEKGVYIHQGVKKVAW